VLPSDSCQTSQAGVRLEHSRRHLDPEDDLSVDEMPVGYGWSGWVRDDVRDWLTSHLGPAA
jgi:hypothetical protein